MDNAKTITELRREIRRKLGQTRLSDEAFAMRIGIGVNTLRNVYFGKGCRVDTLVKICDALEIKLSFEKE